MKTILLFIGFFSIVLILFAAAGVDTAAQALPFSSTTLPGDKNYGAGANIAWYQVNTDGFGDPQTVEIVRLSEFDGYLYASTGTCPGGGSCDPSTPGGEVWRSANAIDWNRISLDGFGTISNTWIIVEQSFQGYLYAGTINLVTGGEVWRCATCDGSDWQQVVIGGFNDINNYQVDRIVVFQDTLYATVNNFVTGVEVWRSVTGNPGSWSQTNEDGFGDAKNTGLWALDVFDGYLYVATDQWEAMGTNTHTGVEVWRTPNGTDWDPVNNDGFGDPDNMAWDVETFNGRLYISTYNNNTGSQIWRCAICDGSDWESVVSNGFDNIANVGASLMGSQDNLYACTWNSITGVQVWQTSNISDWIQVNIDGFGDNNNGKCWAAISFNDNLFIGTQNFASGGEIWGSYASPQIGVSPTALTSTQYVNQVVTPTLTIINGLEITLTFSITPSEVFPWLSMDPFSGTIPKHGSLPVSVTFYATSLLPDIYTTTLNVLSNDPVTPVVPVPVSMTVLAANTSTTILSNTPDPSLPGQPITVTIEVTSTYGIPTGVVSVTVSESEVCCSSELLNGVGACTVLMMEPGIYTLTATYSGDKYFLGSTATELHMVLPSKIYLPVVAR